jgi:hypothetical protein
LPTAETVGVFADVLPWECMLHYLEWTHTHGRENRLNDLGCCRREFGLLKELKNEARQ